MERNTIKGIKLSTYNRANTQASLQPRMQENKLESCRHFNRYWNTEQKQHRRYGDIGTEWMYDSLRL
jgi:hypothetical protein